jgi:trigger factor
VDLPEVMVEQRIDNMINDLDINLQSRGMRLEQYLAFSKMDMAALKEQYREPATEAVKGDMVLEAIVKAENIEAAPEDLEAEMVTMASAYGSKVKDVAKIIQKQGYTGAFLQSILRKKATQLILDTVEKA